MLPGTASFRARDLLRMSVVLHGRMFRPFVAAVDVVFDAILYIVALVCQSLVFSRSVFNVFVPYASGAEPSRGSEIFF